MKQKEYTTNLLQAVENKEPLQVYLKVGKDVEYYDKFYFNEKDCAYQGQLGYIGLDIIFEIINGNEEFNHIKLEVCEERS